MRISDIVGTLALVAVMGVAACGGDAQNGATADTSVGGESGAAAPALDTTGGAPDAGMTATPPPAGGMTADTTGMGATGTMAPAGGDTATPATTPPVSGTPSP